MFWRIYRRFVQPQMPAGGADSFACTRQVRDVLVSLPEANSALVGLLFWVGFRRELVAYPRAGQDSRQERMDVQAQVPVRIRHGLCVLGPADHDDDHRRCGRYQWSARGQSSQSWLRGRWGAIDVRGYTPLMLAVLFSFSTTLLALGIVGGYVWRIFEHTKGRPVPLVHSVEQIAPAVPAPVARNVERRMRR